MVTPTPPSFKLLPVVSPMNDIKHILTIAHYAFEHDPLTALTHNFGMTSTELQQYLHLGSEGIRKRLETKDGDRARFVKMVIDDTEKEDDEKVMVAYASWLMPKRSEYALKPVEARPNSEKGLGGDAKTEAGENKDNEQATDSAAAPDDKAKLAAQVEAQVKAKSIELLGQGWETRFWHLGSLATDPKYQHLDFAAQLVRWGIEEAELDSRTRPQMVEGALTISSPAAVKVYLKQGMTAVGEMVHDVGMGTGDGGYRHVWLVKRFGAEGSAPS